MPTVAFDGVAAKDAIAQIEQRSKRLITTQRWDDMRGEAHAKAFTVAGATKAELLADLYGAVEKAVKEGQSIGQFRQAFDQTVQQHGWEYKGSRSWRTRVIYDTNMRTAHAAGKWKRIQATKRALPYLVYMTVNDAQVRDDHRKWHSICLPVDDPWWQKHYPPNGWGCRCYVIQASASMLKRMGIEVSQEAPPDNPTERVNSRSGEVYGNVPEGIDVGWDYNVGQAWLGPDIAYGKHLASLPPELTEQLLEKSRIKSSLSAKNKDWQRWVEQVETDGKTGSQFVVGVLPGEVLATLKRAGTAPLNASITVMDGDLNHLRGKHKGAEKRLADNIFKNLPQQLHNYEAAYLHSNGSLILVFGDDLGGKRGRAAIRLDMTKRGAVFNSIRSLGVIDVNNLRQAEYSIIAGKKI